MLFLTMDRRILKLWMMKCSSGHVLKSLRPRIKLKTNVQCHIRRSRTCVSVNVMDGLSPEVIRSSTRPTISQLRSFHIRRMTLLSYINSDLEGENLRKGRSGKGLGGCQNPTRYLTDISDKQHLHKHWKEEKEISDIVLIPFFSLLSSP